MSRRDVGRACVALAGGYLLAGCQPQRPSIATATTLDPSAGIAAPDQVAPDQVQALLDRRAQALLNGDEQGFLAELDQSNQEMIQRERLRFANLSQFELSNLGFVMPQQLARPGATAEFSPVLQITQLTADDSPGGVAPAEAFRYVVASREGTLVATDVVPLSGDAAAQHDLSVYLHADAPWNVTPLRVLQADNVWLAGDDTMADLESFVAAAQAQVGKVEALWGDRPRFPGYILFFSRDPNTIRTWYGIGARNPSGPLPFDGLQMSLQGVRTNGQIYDGEWAGARIVVNLSSIEQLDNVNTPEAVMRHELVHAITAREVALPTSTFTEALRIPKWAIEGFANWVGYLEDPPRQDQERRWVADGVRRGRFTGLPPDTESFYGDDIHFNYNLSSSLFRFIEQTTGRDAAIEFYAHVIRNYETPDEPLVGRPAFDDLCQGVLGTSGDALLAQWGSFVRAGA